MSNCQIRVKSRNKSYKLLILKNLYVFYKQKKCIKNIFLSSL
jgi:hypothetical protein